MKEGKPCHKAGICLVKRNSRTMKRVRKQTKC